MSPLGVCVSLVSCLPATTLFATTRPSCVEWLPVAASRPCLLAQRPSATIASPLGRSALRQRPPCARHPRSTAPWRALDSPLSANTSRPLRSSASSRLGPSLVGDSQVQQRAAKRPLVGGLVVPPQRLSSVALCHALAFHKHRAQMLLPLRVPLFSRLAIPMQCLGVALRHPSAVLESHAHVVLRLRVPSLRCLREPPHHSFVT